MKPGNRIEKCMVLIPAKITLADEVKMKYPSLRK